MIHSDDPSQPVVNYHIWLDKNSAPVITASTATVAASQGKHTKVEVSAEDPENEAFSLSFNDEKGYTSVAEFNAADGVAYENGVFSVPAGKQLKATLNIVPEYGYDKVGNGKIAFTAADVNGNASDAIVNYSIEFSNRAPEFTGSTELSYSEGEQSGVISFASIFSDPDGDEFSCTASSSDSKVASVFASEDGMIINAKKAGKAVVTVTAIDKNNGLTKQDITVNVASTTGINGVSAGNGNMAVDASDGTVNVVFNGNVAEAVMRVYTTAGQLVAQKTVKNLHAGDKVAISLNGNAAGVYNLNATLDGEASTVKFIVK